MQPYGSCWVHDRHCIVRETKGGASVSSAATPMNRSLSRDCTATRLHFSFLLLPGSEGPFVQGLHACVPEGTARITRVVAYTPIRARPHLRRHTKLHSAEGSYSPYRGVSTTSKPPPRMPSSSNVPQYGPFLTCSLLLPTSYQGLVIHTPVQQYRSPDHRPLPGHRHNSDLATRRVTRRHPFIELP